MFSFQIWEENGIVKNAILVPQQKSLYIVRLKRIITRNFLKKNKSKKKRKKMRKRTYLFLLSVMILIGFLPMVPALAGNSNEILIV